MASKITKELGCNICLVRQKRNLIPQELAEELEIPVWQLEGYEKIISSYKLSSRNRGKGRKNI